MFLIITLFEYMTVINKICNLQTCTIIKKLKNIDTDYTYVQFLILIQDGID